MDLYTKLFSSVELLSNTFSSRMEQYDEDLKNVGSETAAHKTIASLSREFTEFKAFIWKAMGVLKSQMELLATGLDRHEMAARGKVLLIHGLADGKDSDLQSGVISIVSQEMKIADLTANDITSCHRLGSNPNKPRPVLVRFASRMKRDEVWRNKAQLKGSGITLSEFLTAPRRNVFLSARKHFGIRRAWTSDGKIVIQVTDKIRVKLETETELRQLILKYPSESTPENTASANSKSTTPAALDKKSRKPAK